MILQRDIYKSISIVTVGFEFSVNETPRPESESESESELLYDWRFTANQFVLAPSPLRLTISNIFFQLNTFCHSPYVTSSLKGG
jgi:hypothetical protein